MRRGQKMTPEQRENVRRAQNDPKVNRKRKRSYPKERRIAASKMQWEDLTPEEKEAKMLPARTRNKECWENSTTKENWIKALEESRATPQARRRRSKGQKKRWAGLPPEKQTEIIHTMNDRRRQLLAAARAAVPQSPGGRPRKDAIRMTVEQLRAAGKSWGQIQAQINRETGQNLGEAAYRLLVQRRQRDSSETV